MIVRKSNNNRVTNQEKKQRFNTKNEAKKIKSDKFKRRKVNNLTAT